MPKQLYIPLPCAAARRQMVDRLLGELLLLCSRSFLQLYPAAGRVCQMVGRLPGEGTMPCSRWFVDAPSSHWALHQCWTECWLRGPSCTLLWSSMRWDCGLHMSGPELLGWAGVLVGIAVN